MSDFVDIEQRSVWDMWCHHPDHDLSVNERDGRHWLGCMTSLEAAERHRRNHLQQKHGIQPSGGRK